MIEVSRIQEAKQGLPPKLCLSGFSPLNNIPTNTQFRPGTWGVSHTRKTDFQPTPL